MEVTTKTSSIVTKKTINKKVIAGSTVGTCSFVGAAVALIGKKQGHKLFSKFEWSNWNKPKDWLISKIDYDEKEMIGIAGSSVFGGFIGGSLFDKRQNIKAKFKEGIFQMIANIVMPISTVGIAVKTFEKFAASKFANQKAKNITKAIITIGTLLSGMFIGNKVGNFINDKIFNSQKERKMSIKDLSAQVDDTYLAASMLTQGSGAAKSWGKIFSIFIPFALLMPGLETGLKTKNDY